MDWITENIALGDWMDAEKLPHSGITRVLNMAKEVSIRHELPALHMHILDGVEMQTNVLEKAREFLGEADDDDKTLVHCVAGVSRSPSIVAMHLALKHGRTFDEALAFVKSKRSVVDPDAAVMRSVRRFVKSKQGK